ncbi:nuclease-related domain-containing protein [Lederbergia citrea]|uniref:nuclease-related domain-containing protein n=1 Tax=Lederbergia citrea TaxID=2833581 RepID=UPI001BC8EA5A|nr:nuclease-related domain-containing protein [Lederbergia citrea]MBS4178487.1 NERD domain-containing protein [Lederbergia citrea]MBS4205158.1 NERD domain-containing protein [Lederbergia citrea]
MKRVDELIIKQRKIPIKIKKLEALLRRLPMSHSKWKEVVAEAARSWAGYRGEESLDYYLSFLPDKEYFIFHDLRIPYKTHHFQMDFLIQTNYFLLILEVKNISGTITFDPDLNQMIRTLNGIEEAFPDPVQQVKHQQFQLSSLLQQKKYKNVPIESLVVMANPYSLLKMPAKRPDYLQKVIRSTRLLEKIQFFHKKHKDEKLTRSELRKISKLLLINDTPHNPNMLQRFELSKSDILPGVFCEKCSTMTMSRSKGSWVCNRCSYSYKNAHLNALEDYSFLINSTISNSETRKFLQLSSSSVAQKLLKTSNFTPTGTTKDRRYHLYC